METSADINRQSAALPPIDCLDKIKREEDYHQRNHSTAAMVSPSFAFNRPPPPPYPQTHASSASAPSSAGLPPPNNLISPPGSRRTSGDDQPPPPPPSSAPRQSLPSIFEALGRSDSAPLAYPTQQPGPPSTAPGPAFFQTSATSPADAHRRSTFTSGPPDLHRSIEIHRPAELPKSGSIYRPAEPIRFSQVPPPQSPYMSRPPPQQGHEPPRPTSQTHSDGRQPYPPQHPRLPSLHPIRTGNSPVTTPRTVGYPPSQQPSPGYEPTPHSAPAPFNGYSQYGPPSYQYPQANSGPVYTPSTASAAPTRYPQSQPAFAPGHDYHNGIDERGETVKRHLDSFELEASLNELAECSGQMLDFSQKYGTRAHSNQRTGLSQSSVPHLETVEELLGKSDKLRDSLLRIRDVVEQQHAAMEDQMKDPNRDAHMRYTSEANGSYSDKVDGSGGFANGEGKKRRGRAAPPGRCHSCNRAETPEWRRGPDGARTLCNACGLHYAKLTRKMGASKPVIGTSNLRPKSIGPGSPGV